MSKHCKVTGKAVLSGNLVSHSNRKTRRKFSPNLQIVSLASEILGHDVRLRISTAGLRTVDHNGGLDQFLLTTKSKNLPEEALKLKRRLRRILAKKKAAAQVAA